MNPTIVFETYWRFAAERQAMYYRRMGGHPSPWTDDAILGQYRFTNAYRAADRVSQYLIREIQYREDRSREPQELFFRTMLFKIFNRVETWETIERSLGPIAWRTIDFDALQAVLDRCMSAGDRIYSAAYIMPSPAFGHLRKHSNHLALLKQMMDERMPDRLRQLPTLRDVYEALLRYPGVGPFLAFQYAIDLNYSELLAHDESTFVVAGPGALDGISKCFTSIGDKTPEDIINWVCDRQEVEFKSLGLQFQSLFGRKLQPIDCQNLFCEISKYARMAHPDFAGLSGRTRIKQSYRADPTPLPPPTFPPRWRIAIPSKADRRGVKLGLVA